MRNFAFTLAKNLKRTVHQLGQEMGVREFYEWMAYESINNNKEYREELENTIALERSAKQSEIERAEAIKQMFKSFGR